MLLRSALTLSLATPAAIIVACGTDLADDARTDALDTEATATDAAAGTGAEAGRRLVAVSTREYAGDAAVEGPCVVPDGGSTPPHGGSGGLWEGGIREGAYWPPGR